MDSEQSVVSATGGAADLAAGLNYARWAVGDRLGSFGVVLPATPSGPVVLAVERRMSYVLQHCYPGSVALHVDGDDDSAELPAPGPVLFWDKIHSPLQPGSIELLIVDSTKASVEVLRPALAEGGTVASIGVGGEFLLYPIVGHPEHVWKEGWPIPTVPGLVSQLRRTVGLLTGRRRAVPSIKVEGPVRASFADLLIADLERLTGKPSRLVGVQTAGHTILRVRQSDGDIAVRLSFSDPRRSVGCGAEVAAAVPAIRHLIPREIASGHTRGRPWLATEWLPRRRSLRTTLTDTQKRRWRTAHETARALASAPTGSTGPGWADTWCESVSLLPAPAKSTMVRVLQRIETDIPTGWCHGDLWTGNILLDRRGDAVIDWDNATPRGPLGIDWLLIEALRSAADNGKSVGAECIGLIDHSSRIGGVAIGGKRWDSWDRDHREAFAVAAFLLYLRNRSLYDMGRQQIDENLDPVLEAIAPPTEDTAPIEDDGASGQAAKGAMWLGASGLVVKVAQTAVLLVLAALLAPSALGVIAIGTLVMNVASTATGLGTSTALIYWQGDVRRAARSALTLALAMAIALTALAWVTAPAMAKALHAEDGGVGVIRGLMIVLPCHAVASVTMELLRRDLAFRRRVIPDIVASSVGAVVAIWMAFDGYGVTALVVGQIVQGVLTMLVSWMVGPWIWPGYNGDDVKGLLGYGGHLAGANMVQLLLLNIDYVIVARTLDASALGQYSLAFRLSYLPYLNIAYVISGAAFPYLCRLQRERVGQAAEKITVAAITLLLPLSLAIALFADSIVLLGDKWEPAVPALRLLAVFVVLLSFIQFAQISLNAIGRPRDSFQLRLTHFAALVPTLWLVAPYGIVYVALGQIAVAVLIGGLALHLARRHVPGFVTARLGASLTPSVVSAMIMTAAVLAAQQGFNADASSLPAVIAIGLLGLAAYAIPIWILDRDNLIHTFQLVRRRP